VTEILLLKYGIVFCFLFWRVGGKLFVSTSLIGKFPMMTCSSRISAVVDAAKKTQRHRSSIWSSGSLTLSLYELNPYGRQTSPRAPTFARRDLFPNYIILHCLCITVVCEGSRS